MAYLLLAAVVWATTTQGGDDLRDLVLVLALVIAATVVGRAGPPRDVALWIALPVLLCWLLVDGPVRSGWRPETIRVPMLVVIATFAAFAVRSMGSREREVVVVGLIGLGAVQAAIGLAQVVLPMSSDIAGRAAGTVGSPNALGMLLVACAVLTARELHRRRSRLVAMALALQCAGVLATGSRAAIVIGGVLLIGYLASHVGGAGRVLAGVAVVVGSAVVIWRSITELQDRPYLWGQALARIAANPLVGSGPGAAAYSALPGGRVTTHAHNEALQWGVDYGIIGLTLALVLLLLAVRSWRRRVTHDRWLECAALTLLAAGLTDFSLRVTAMALAAAVVMALAATHDSATRAGDPSSGRMQSASTIYGRIWTIVFPVRRSLGLKAATASSRVAM